MECFGENQPRVRTTNKKDAFKKKKQLQKYFKEIKKQHSF